MCPAIARLAPRSGGHDFRLRIPSKGDFDMPVWRLIFTWGICSACTVLVGPLPAQEAVFVRGDANANGTVDIVDGIYALHYLFLGAPPPTCFDAADANDDGVHTLDEGVYLFGFLFLGGPPPPPPAHICGPDPTPDRFGCESYPVCEPLIEVTVLGRLTLPDGTAADGATITDPLGRELQAGEGGVFHYEERIPESVFDAELVFTFQNYSARIDLSNLRDGEVLDIGTVVLTLPDGIQRVLLSGQVSLPDERAASRARVQVNLEQTTADASGTFSMELFLPLHDVTTVVAYVSEGGFFFLGEKDFVVDPEEDVDLEKFCLRQSGHAPLMQGRTDVYPTRNEPRRLATGDFTGDGVIDLVIANAGDASVSIYRGFGDGTFENAKTVRGFPAASAIAAGEVNGDGLGDFAITRVLSTRAYTIAWSIDESLSYRAEQFDSSTTLNPRSVVLGDLNGDGLDDLAVARQSDVLVRLATADERILGAGTAYATLSAEFVAMKDVDGDGALDVVAGGGGGVTVHLGDGAGGRRRARRSGGGFRVADFGDFNNDGFIDLVSTSLGADVELRLGRGDGGFRQTRTFSAVENTLDLRTADINGDELMDVVTVRGSGTIGVHLGIGHGPLARPISRRIGGAPSALVVEDFNRDGRVDVATVSAVSNQLNVYVNGAGS